MTPFPRAIVLASLALIVGGVCPGGAQAQGKGQIDCSVTENQARSSATMVVSQGEKRVASGACGRPVRVTPGVYDVTLRLDSALDRPSKTRRVTVAANATALARADFSTAMLQVSVKARSARGAIMIAVHRGSSKIGTLRNGKQHTLSAGKYTVSVKQAGKEKTEEIELRPGQRRTVKFQL